MEDEFKDLYVSDPEAIPEKDIRWWSRYMSRRKFKTEAEAREEIFRILQHNDKQSWAILFGQQGEPRNRWEADNLPLYQNRHGHWKVGRPLSHYRRMGSQVQEYLSNATSDFSDGTNGEPSAQASFAGDGGTNVGLPNYKYLERKQRRHDKLRALIKRRSPTHHSRVDWDTRARAGMHESEDEELLKELGEPGPILQKMEHRPDCYEVSLFNGDWIGTVYKEPEAHMPKVPTLLKLHRMFPWIAQPPWDGWRGQDRARFKTLEQAVAHLASLAKHEPVNRIGQEFNDILQRTPLGQMPKEENESVTAAEIVKTLLEA